MAEARVSRPRDRRGVTGLRAALSALAVALAMTGCTTDVDLGNGITQRGDHLFHYEGPEVEATLGTHQTSESLGENWLVLGVWLRAASQSGTLTIDRKSVSIVSPDGHHLPLVSQEEFRSAYSQIHTLVRRAEFSTPGTGSPTAPLQICDRWFFAEIGEGFATDELYLTSFMQCTGPLVFNVPRGVQPGRWRLVIELEESRVDIPFEVVVR
jgi:hypothetical protein